MAERDIPIVENPSKENKTRRELEVERQSSKCQSILKRPGEGFYRPKNLKFKFPKSSWVMIL